MCYFSCKAQKITISRGFNLISNYILLHNKLRYNVINTLLLLHYFYSLAKVGKFSKVPVSRLKILLFHKILQENELQ